MKRVSKILALLLAMLMLVLAFAGCGAKSPTAISFGSTELTANMLSYWMSTYKAVFLYQVTGGTQDYPQIWTTELTEGITYDDYVSAMCVSELMVKAVCNELFSTYGLTITAEEENTLDERINKLVQQTGSKAALNSALSAFGINAEILREINEIDLKVSKVQEYLYGENGTEKATAEEIDKYYNENYYRTKYIYISTKYDYELDANGELILDEETGAYKTRELTASETTEKKAFAKQLEADIAAGEDFDKLVLEHSMDIGMQTFTDGYYFTMASTYIRPDIMAAVQELKVGETKTLESEDGVAIIKRYELQPKKYEDQEYVPYMFANISSTIGMTKLQELVSGYADTIVMNNAVIASYPVATATPNFYY